MAVEREQRTARVVSRRSQRGNRVVRYAVRGLLVAGVAGAAWMFWSSAAQAATPDTGALLDTSSLLGTVERAPAGLLDTVATAAPVVKAPVVKTVAPVLRTVTATTTTTVTTVTQVTAPVARTVHTAVATATAVVTATPRPTAAHTDSGPRPSIVGIPRSTSDASTGSPDPDHTAALPAAVAGPAAQGIHTRKSAASRLTARPVGDRAGPNGTLRQSDRALPARPQAPMPAFPVSGTGLVGASTGASNSTMDGGATAVIAHGFATAAVCQHRSVPAPDVAARPLTAAVPTVSPD